MGIKKFDRNKFYYIVMALCFIYAGVSAILLVYQLSFHIRPEPTADMVAMFNNSNMTQFLGRPGFSPEAFPRPDRGFGRGPFTSTTSLITASFGFAVSLLAGLSLMDLLKKKERKKISAEVLNATLTPDEKNVIQVLELNDGELTQSELVGRSKLSKVKVSRIVKRLETLGVISKYPYGVTNKIKLEKNLSEE